MIGDPVTAVGYLDLAIQQRIKANEGHIGIEQKVAVAFTNIAKTIDSYGLKYRQVERISLSFARNYNQPT